MKRKTIVLLSSIMAGALLVGGSFATFFAVTDEADPDGRNVTPGTLHDDTTTYVTLTWGTKTLNDIENLKVGENRKLGVVGLKSTLDGGYNGLFTVSLTDKTVRTAAEAGNKKLIDYLTVSVYDGEKNLVVPPQSEEATALPEGALVEDDDLSSDYKHVYAAVGAPSEHKYTVFITYDENANLYSSQMQNDRVYVEVNWDPLDDDIATSRQVYYVNTSDWDEVYAYYWVGDVNNNFPGAKMDLYDEDEGIYTITVPANMEGIIFNAGDKVDEHKTNDISFEGYDAANNVVCYKNGAWVVLDEQEEQDDVQYDTFGLDLGEWANDEAVIFVHSWGVKDRDYKVVNPSELQLPEDVVGFILVRMQGGSEEINYESAWNKTPDLEKGSAGQVLTFKNWGEGSAPSVFEWVTPEP